MVLFFHCRAQILVSKTELNANMAFSHANLDMIRNIENQIARILVSKIELNTNIAFSHANLDMIRNIENQIARISCCS